MLFWPQENKLFDLQSGLAYKEFKNKKEVN